MSSRSKTYATESDIKRFEDIKRLYLQARQYSKTKPKKEREQQETKHIEAFLLLTVILEGTLVNLALKLLEKRTDLNALYDKRRKRYDYDNVINDLYLLGEINTSEFKKLEKFRMKRNEYIHNLLSEDTEIVENRVIRIYREYRGLAWTMINKFRKRIGKIKKITI